MDALHIIFVALFLAGLVVRDGYEALKAAGRIDTRDGRVFAIVFGSMCVLWVSWFGIGLTAPSRLAAPDALRWSGLGLVILGVGLVAGGMWQLRGVENIDHLVTGGLFSKLRHPMYVGFLLLILGWCAYEAAPALLAVACFSIASILWWRWLEERDLESVYGEAYAEYRAGTWF
jgi:protein-S-isoprenylcysteine O-methyltransferase Ste14